VEISLWNGLEINFCGGHQKISVENGKISGGETFLEVNV